MTAKIFTTFNQKGGCGKTTLTMALAAKLGVDGYKVLVVDTDEQGTASRWAASAPDDRQFPARVIGLPHAGSKVHRELQNHINDYDFIIVDCPPSAHSSSAASALLVSDLAIIPFIPAPADAWALAGARRLVENASIHNETLKMLVVINCKTRTSLADDVALMIQDDEGYPVAKSSFTSRSAYRECQAFGGSVVTVGKDKKAIEEVENLTKEILELLA